MDKRTVVGSVLVGVLLGAAGLGYLRPVRAEEPATRPAYEHTVLEFSMDEGSARMGSFLNSLGDAGWRVVGVIPAIAGLGSAHMHKVILERPRTGRPAPKAPAAVPGQPPRPVPQANDRDAPAGRR